jgi:hypothetical protein
MHKGIKEKDIRDFEKCCRKLSEIMRRIQEYCPEANGYLDDDTMNLMCGPAHTGVSDNPMHENVVTEVSMPDFNGGGW